MKKFAQYNNKVIWFDKKYQSVEVVYPYIYINIPICIVKE